MGLSLLPLVFSLVLLVASRVLYPYSTDNKTSRINGERILHSEGHPERFTELHEEEEREEGDRGEQEEKKGDSREDKSRQYSVP